MDIATNYTSRSLTPRLFAAGLVTGPRVYHVVHDVVLIFAAVETQFLFPRAYHLPADDVVSHRPSSGRESILEALLSAVQCRPVPFNAVQCRRVGTELRTVHHLAGVVSLPLAPLTLSLFPLSTLLGTFAAY